ncbi:MAG: carboxypeptidase regulatory-like domain-containing protein [Blastocatellia bacterium]|nr:carboxypeptidase regulatory-like domain-containing protein [Blastocatellia bacterium]
MSGFSKPTQIETLFSNIKEWIEAGRTNLFKFRLAGCLGLALIAAAAGLGQTPPDSFEVSGIVLDPSNAVIAGARVVLRREGVRSEKITTTDQEGRFRFGRVASGDYEIEAQKEGFKPSITRLKVGAKSPAPLRIILPIADLREEMAVDRSNQTSTNPDENLDVIKLDREALKNLPVLGNDVIGSLANLLDASSVGSGGPTVIVDGLERPGKKVPASQIQEVRINQNPYSAEFSRPGRGRIEVITRPGSPAWNGEFNFIFRDHRLDARNAFARERPDEQRRIYEGILSGPIGNGNKTSFLFGFDREEEDLQAIVFAQTPDGTVAENVANPSRDTEFSFRFNHEVSKKTTLSIRFEVAFDSTGNGGVGGFNLREVATDSTGRDQDIYFTHRRIISPHLINEFTLLAEHDRGSTRSARPGISRIIVLDAFTGGGGQTDRRATEYLLQLNEILSWNKGKHFVKSGLNIPAISRRTLSDRTNFGGTFSFSTLADYLNNRPFLFSINQGDGDLIFWQKELGLFVLDNILVRPNFSIGAGLRYDRQNHLGDNNNLAPRLSFAFAPDKKRKTVLRGGAGIFYDRTGSGAISDRLRFDGQRLRQVTITDPGYPDPLSSGGMLSAEPGSIVRFAPDIRSPYMLQFSLGIERQLTGSLTATANYINTRGIKLFRSRNTNAPPPPLYIARPDTTIGVLRQIESSARSQAHALEFILRGRMSRFFNGTIQYNLGRAYNNASGINSLPADNYDLTGEWSRAEFDERHRFNLLGTIEAGEWFNLGLTLSLASGRPYSLTTGRDRNRDAVASDRPAGVRRNSLQGPGRATLNVGWAKEFQLKKSGEEDEGPAITIGVDAFNVLNRTNYAGFVGNLSSPFFGLPVAARPARRMQLTLGFEF